MSSNHLHDAGAEVLAQLLTSPLLALKVEHGTLQCASLFDVVSPAVKERARRALAAACQSTDRRLARCMGCMVGMAVGDSIGHNFEFLPVRDAPSADGNGPLFEYPSATQEGGRVQDPYNVFKLKPGQWTDDTSLGLCLADSLLAQRDYDGANIRVWFWNWWFNGLNNAFRLDLDRQAAKKTKKKRKSEAESLSVGLGGNIEKSLLAMCAGETPLSCLQGAGEDAGNGSLMRLAAVPLRWHAELATARMMAFESSLTTHPGPLAAEACALMAHVIVCAVNHEDPMTARDFLDVMQAQYTEHLQQQQKLEASPARATLLRLLQGEEKDKSKERCWNWREPAGQLGLEQTLVNRGDTYNGYPVSAEYFGAWREEMDKPLDRGQGANLRLLRLNQSCPIRRTANQWLSE
jgi:ADP-ribosylglycohydrolase